MIQSKTWYFVIDGSINTSIENGVRDDRKNISDKFLNIDMECPINFVICCGLTKNGWDGSGSRVLGVFKYPLRIHDQLGVWRNEYETPLVENGFPVYVCLGVNDTHTGRPTNYRGVAKFIKDRHNATNDSEYVFIHKKVRFICLGLYPSNLEWLEDHLPNDDTPIVITFYYDILGDYWSSPQKDKFWSIIERSKVIAICCTQPHKKRLYRWHNIPVINGYGKRLALIGIHDDELIDVKFDNGKDEFISTTNHLNLEV